MLAKRAGDEIDGELLARGYWQVLGSKLTEQQMSDLTELVLERCKWFPTVAECREIMDEQSYINPFYVSRRQDQLSRNGYLPSPAPQLAAPAQCDRSGEADETRQGLGPEGESAVLAQQECAQTTDIPS